MKRSQLRTLVVIGVVAAAIIFLLSFVVPKILSVFKPTSTADSSYLDATKEAVWKEGSTEMALKNATAVAEIRRQERAKYATAVAKVRRQERATYVAAVAEIFQQESDTEIALNDIAVEIDRRQIALNDTATEIAQRQIALNAQKQIAATPTSVPNSLADITDTVPLNQATPRAPSNPVIPNQSPVTARDNCADAVASRTKSPLFQLSACQDGEMTVLNNFGSGFDDLITTAEDKTSILVYTGSQYGISKDPNARIVYDLDGMPYGVKTLAVLHHFLKDDHGGLLVSWSALSSDAPIPNIVALYFVDINSRLHDRPDWIVRVSDEAASGSRVAEAGDMDCDNYTDIAVSIPKFQVQERPGEVLIYSGWEIAKAIHSGLSMRLDSMRKPQAVARGEQAGEEFGSAIARAGKVQEQQGCDALIIGAPGYSPNNSLTQAGRTIVIYGRNQLFSSTDDLIVLSAGWQEEGDQENERFGTSVSSAGNVQKIDGSDSVIVGAPFYKDANGKEVGAVFVYYGSPSGLQPDQIWKELGQPNGQIGWIVQGGVDLNGCGFDDIAIISQDPLGSRNMQSVYIYPGGEAGLEHTTVWDATWSGSPSQLQSLAVDVDRGGGELSVGTENMGHNRIYLYTAPQVCSRK